MKRLLIVLCGIGLFAFLHLPCYAMAPYPPYPGDDDDSTTTKTLHSEVVAKAAVDECFNGIGQPYKAGPDCSSGEKEKANQAYLWGLTKAGDNLWFGTAANMVCLVRAFGDYASDEFESTPYYNNLWACEYSEGQYMQTEMDVTGPAVFGDFRPPKIYTYNVTTGGLTDKTAQITNVYAKTLLQTTFGLRSAVAKDGLVILAGPMAMGAGINVFVFNSITNTFVGATTLTDYQNIRKWLIVNDILYAAVADEDGGGKLIRWTGTASNPLSFIEVGSFDGAGAELCEHNGRLYVGTWPSDHNEVSPMAGIWMSPVIPDGGLTASHLNSWSKVWKASDYEPDPLNASMYGCGAMKSFGGYLYWGTMHVHGKAALVYIDTYNLSIYEYPDAYFKSWRATAIFRGKDFDSNKKVELLYGESSLPVLQNYYGWRYWTYKSNNMGGVSGKYGTSGFNNEYNNYTWSMAIYNDELYVGTMDHAYLWLDWENLQMQYYGGAYFYYPTWLRPDSEEYGADLWRFPDANSAAVEVSHDGLGNYTNYGFRNIIVDDDTDTGLYVGTANPANIYQDSSGHALGGWELIRVWWE